MPFLFPPKMTISIFQKLWCLEPSALSKFFISQFFSYKYFLNLFHNFKINVVIWLSFSLRKNFGYAKKCSITMSKYLRALIFFPF